MNAVLDSIASHWSAIFGSAGGMILFGAWARHIPDWPLTLEKMWSWFKDTAQEVASQKSGTTPPVTDPNAKK